MVDVTTEIIIYRPVALVADYAANPDNAPEWYVNIKSVEWKTQKPLTIGSKIRFAASFLGRNLSYIYEVVEFIPCRKFVMRTAEGPFPMETTYAWEALSADGTHMILRNRGNPNGFYKLFAPFMAAAMRRANQKDLQKLKRVLEQQNT